MAIKIVRVTPSTAPETPTLFEYSFTGLSSDTKPTSGYPLADDSTFEELDTKKMFRYSTTNTNAATSNGWWEM